MSKHKKNQLSPVQEAILLCLQGQALSISELQIALARRWHHDLLPAKLLKDIDQLERMGRIERVVEDEVSVTATYVPRYQLIATDAKLSHVYHAQGGKQRTEYGTEDRRETPKSTLHPFVQWLLQRYPTAWREQHEPEMVSMLASMPLTLKLIFDLLSGILYAYQNPTYSPQKIVSEYTHLQKILVRFLIYMSLLIICIVMYIHISTVFMIYFTSANFTIIYNMNYDFLQNLFFTPFSVISTLFIIYAASGFYKVFEDIIKQQNLKLLILAFSGTILTIILCMLPLHILFTVPLFSLFLFWIQRQTVLKEATKTTKRIIFYIQTIFPLPPLFFLFLIEVRPFTQWPFWQNINPYHISTFILPFFGISYLISSLTRKDALVEHVQSKLILMSIATISFILISISMFFSNNTGWFANTSVMGSIFISLKTGLMLLIGAMLLLLSTTLVKAWRLWLITPRQSNAQYVETPESISSRQA